MNISEYDYQENNESSESEGALTSYVYGHWSQFGRLSTLSINFADSLSSVAKIYGNGLNQVSVVINLRMLDKDNAILNLSDADLYEAVYLCDYNTGEKISTSPPSWIYSNVKNEYNNPISYMSVFSSGEETDVQSDIQHFDSDTKVLTLHISSNKMSSGKLFAVGIDIPNVGTFDTSKNGTTTPNGASGSVFRSPSNVTVIAEQPIDYSVKKNVSIEYGTYATLSTSQHHTTRKLLTNWDHYNGIVKRKIVYLRSSAGYPFLKTSVTYTPIGSDEPSTGTVSYWDLPGMNAVYKYNPTLPCAVIGKKMSDNNFNAFFWFPNGIRLDFEGSWFSERKSGLNYYKTNFRTQLYDTLRLDNTDGSVKLLLYTFICQEPNDNRLYWNNTFREPKVTVTDIFGNRGTIYLAFNGNNPESVDFHN